MRIAPYSPAWLTRTMRATVSASRAVSDVADLISSTSCIASLPRGNALDNYGAERSTAEEKRLSQQRHYVPCRTILPFASWIAFQTLYGVAGMVMLRMP